MHIQNKKLYTEQATEYAAASYWRSDEQQIVNRFFRGKQVLVLGCGGGRTLRPIHDLGYKVTAIDIVPKMVEYAREQVSDLPIKVHEMDAAKLGFADDTFDTVFFPFHGIDYVEPDIYAAVREAKRVMRTDGVFIFSSHNRLFIKKLHRYFVGKIDVYRGLHTYRTNFNDRRKLKKYFGNVQVIQRISLTNRKGMNWKDKLYLLFPWLNKSTYFVCSEPL